MNIDAMEAGPEMDAMVAERVMGWTDLMQHDGKRRLQKDQTYYGRISTDGGTRTGDDGTGFYRWVHNYSTDIGAAWEVYMEMYNKPSANRWVLVERLMGLPSASFFWNDNRPDAVAQAETMPLAICRAALKAVEAKP